MQYRKKPVIIEAVQHPFNMPDAPNGVPDWLMEAWKSGVLFTRDGSTFVKTLEGEHKVSYGDFIIRGVKGELYPCKPDIFEATYETVFA